MDQKMVERNIYLTLFAYILHLSFYARIQTRRINRHRMRIGSQLDLAFNNVKPKDRYFVLD